MTLKTDRIEGVADAEELNELQNDKQKQHGEVAKKKVYANKTYKVKILNKATNTIDCTFVDGCDWEEVAKKVNGLLKENEFIKSVEFVMEGRRI